MPINWLLIQIPITDLVMKYQFVQRIMTWLPTAISRPSPKYYCSLEELCVLRDLKSFPPVLSISGLPFQDHLPAKRALHPGHFNFPECHHQWSAISRPSPQDNSTGSKNHASWDPSNVCSSVSSKCSAISRLSPTL